MKARILVVLAALTVFTGLGLGVANASIPDSSGVIHACYQSPPPMHGANLQVIDTGAGGSCSGGMASLTWNQTGPQGPTGPTGPQGPQGPAATSTIVTKDVSYTPPGGSAFFSDFQTVDCPSGTNAINGGIVQSTASTAWQTAIAGGATGNAGQAITQDAAEIDDAGGGAPNTTNPVNLSLPRAVNSGTSWKMEVTGVFAVANGTDYGVTVTLYAVCL